MGKIEDVNAWLSSYKWEQPELDMCLTACIKMILDELSHRHNVPGLKMKLSKINKLCQYRKNFGPRLEIVIPAINSKIEAFGYFAVEKEGKDRFSKLREILFDDDMSIPIVGFGEKYLSDQKQSKYIVPGSPHWDHAVAVIDINNDNDIKICDPMEKYLLKSSRVKTIQTILSLPEFLNYWGNADSPYWMMWIEKKIKKKGPLEKWVEM